MKLIYSPKYEVDIGRHPFKTNKYRLVRERLLAEDAFDEADFVEPAPASDADVLRVHAAEYVARLQRGTLSMHEIAQLELPFSKELADVAWLWCGGTIMAGQSALVDGACVHLGGGWHHAFPGHGEGFCVLNDHAVAIRRLRADRAIERAAVIDCDVHQGNGTADIFGEDPNVFTFSIHQQNNYPAVKPPSDLDIGLADGTGDTEYLAHVEEHVPKILHSFKPDIVFYVAGADTYLNDVLGGLDLTIDGHRRRDELVIGESRKRGVPVAVVLAGGYAADVNDTVTIHANTAKVARKSERDSALPH